MSGTLAIRSKISNTGRPQEDDRVPIVGDEALLKGQRKR
jgi:hypothetical protein